MQIDSLKKITTPTARETCAIAASGGFKLSAGDDVSPVEFLQELLAAKNLGDAVQFMAFALPAREAVWWACHCARQVQEDPASPAIAAAVEAAEAWVRRPTEENRRGALARAQATDFQSPAAWAAMAAFWSSGSMAPEHVPDVPAPGHLVGCAVAGAVMLAAVQSEPQLADEKRARFLAAAINIANGGNGRIS